MILAPTQNAHHLLCILHSQDYFLQFFCFAIPPSNACQHGFQSPSDDAPSPWLSEMQAEIVYFLTPSITQDLEMASVSILLQIMTPLPSCKTKTKQNKAKFCSFKSYVI